MNEYRQGYVRGIVTGGMVAGAVAVLLALLSCTAALVPSGKPGCPNRTIWSDSAQRCIAREGR